MSSGVHRCVVFLPFCLPGWLAQLGRTALHLVASLEGSEAVKCAETLIKEGADPLAEGQASTPSLPYRQSSYILGGTLLDPSMPSLLSGPTACRNGCPCWLTAFNACRPDLCHSPQQDGTSPLERSTGDVRTVLLRAAEGALKGGGPAAGLLLALHGMQRNGRHTDVTLACGTGEAKEKEEIRCHAVVLAAQGEFWETLCFGPMARRAGPARVESVTARSAAHVLSFAMRP